MSYDLIVVGGGPGGYVGAIRAAQLDQDVLVIDDEDNLGGVCLNWGCIPTKSLLHHAEQYQYMKNADRYGFEIDNLSVDWNQLIDTSRQAVKRLGKGVEGLFKKNGVEYVNDRAVLTGPDEVTLDDGETHEAENIMIAAGAQPRTLPDIEPNGDRILTSRNAMVLDECPDEIVVLGAGAIGMEFAYFFHSFDADVTVVEMQDSVLPGEDDEVSSALKSHYERDGMTIELKTAVDTVEQNGDSVTVTTEDGETLEAGYALIALGVVPNTDGLWSDELNLRTDDAGWIDVKEDYSTSLPGVYAIGDVTGPPWLAHAASHEGIKTAEGIVTETDIEPLKDEDVPVCTYCQPQVARVGLTEDEAKQEYDEVKIGKFDFRAIGRSVAVDQTEGFVKLVFAGEYDELVGAHLLGHEATELISELNLAMQLEATPHELFETIHPHPTFSEAVMESALDAEERAIHQ
ncbi:MAG: dihydrolipoyl dehydrogenase [bacterium]